MVDLPEVVAVVVVAADGDEVQDAFENLLLRSLLPASMQAMPRAHGCAGRLHGSKWYDYMDIGGRVASGTATEKTSGTRFRAAGD